MSDRDNEIMEALDRLFALVRSLVVSVAKIDQRLETLEDKIKQWEEESQ